jgi:hypothetical protein
MKTSENADTLIRSIVDVIHGYRYDESILALSTVLVRSLVIIHVKHNQDIDGFIENFKKDLSLALTTYKTQEN